MVSAVIEAIDLTKRYRDVAAVDGVSFEVEEGSITGLLGGNGAGKTTLMSLISGQGFASGGTVRVFGQHPVENDRVLSRLCFVRENLPYPNNWRIGHVLQAGPYFHPSWDMELARRLVSDFDLPRRRQIRKFSRGMVSAVGIVVGLASRAPVTIFDEPYLGLDAAARHRFYDLLLADYASHPRTIVVSSHLVDEIANLLDAVLVLERGRLVLDAAAEDLRGRAVVLTGRVVAVDALARPYTVLRREALGSLASITVFGDLDPDLRHRAAEASVELQPASLQQLVVHAGALGTARATLTPDPTPLGAPR